MSTPTPPLDETTPYAPDAWGEGKDNPAAELRAARFQHLEDGLGLADERARTALVKARAALARLNDVEDTQDTLATKTALQQAAQALQSSIDATHALADAATTTAEATTIAEARAQAALNAFVGAAPPALDTWAEFVAEVQRLSGVDTTLVASIAAKYTKPPGGIPAADLAGDVPTKAVVDANTAATQANATAIAGKLSKTDADAAYGQKATVDANTTDIAALQAAAGFVGSDAVLAQSLALPRVTITTTTGADPTTTTTYLDATVTINGTLPYSGPTQVRGRGASTFALEKKPWRLKLAVAASLLGMPAERDWVLLANHYDPSKIRNQLAFELANRCPGLGWTPRMRFVEVTMNGTYRGIYQLGEHVERSAVKIPGLAATGVAGLPLTGVYTLEIDRHADHDPGFTTTLGVMVSMGDPDTTVPEQLNYISQWIQTFETSLFGTSWLDPVTGYARYIDMPSWVDWYIVNELTANLDSNEQSSIKMYKTRDTETTTGRLYLGPVWDFDNSMAQNAFGPAQPATGFWTLNPSNNGEHPGFRWLARMVTDPTFFAMLVTRWVALRSSITTNDTIFSVIDRLTDRATYAVGRDQRRWGQNANVPANTDAMKTWLSQRIAWLNTQWVIDTTAPTAPASLTATPENNAATVTWSASTDDVAVTKYRLRRDGALIVEQAGTTYSDSGLVNGTTYTYTVTAVDSAGNESLASASATATPVATAVSNPPAATLRYRAADLALADSQAISSWPPLVGAGTLVAPPGDEPTFIASAINGRPAARWPSTSNTKRLEAPGTAAAAAQPLSFGIVVQPITNTTQTQAFQAGVELLRTSDARWTIYVGSDSPAFGTATGGSPVVVTGVIASGSADLYVNGAKVASAVAVGSRSWSNSPQLGWHGGVGGRNWQGDIAELVMWNRALSSAEVTQWHTYVQKYYGITTS